MACASDPRGSGCSRWPKRGGRTAQWRPGICGGAWRWETKCEQRRTKGGTTGTRNVARNQELNQDHDNEPREKRLLGVNGRRENSNSSFQRRRQDHDRPNLDLAGYDGSLRAGVFGSARHHHRHGWRRGAAARFFDANDAIDGAAGAQAAASARARASAVARLSASRSSDSRCFRSKRTPWTVVAPLVTAMSMTSPTRAMSSSRTSIVLRAT